MEVKILPYYVLIKKMEVSFFKRRKIFKTTSLLELTPFRKIEHEVSENGLVVLLYPKFRHNKVSRFMLGNKSPYIRLNLDEIGSASWLMIDGNKNIRIIADELSDQMGEKVQPVHDRLGKFLSQLYNNKFISFKELLKKE